MCPVELTRDLSAEQDSGAEPPRFSAMERMMKRQDVILKAMAKKISWLDAAEMIGVCDRTMRRKREEYQKFGYTGLMERRSGKQSSHRVPMETQRKFCGSIGKSISISTFGTFTRNCGMSSRLD
jgi:hypothetical protein